MASVLYRILSGLITSTSNINSKIKLANLSTSGLVFQGDNSDVNISNGVITIGNKKILSGHLSDDILTLIQEAASSLDGVSRSYS